jgi:N-acetylglucosaminyldiphosphoundecaprenol N-acetyl-beta-D-mannosaminyltransferase
MRTVNLLGVDVAACTYEEVLMRITQAVASRAKLYACLANTHTIMEARYDAGLREAFAHASLVLMDGMPLVWLSRRLGEKTGERIRGPSLFVKMCALARDKNFSVFLYGTTQATLARLKKNLEERFPGLRVVGTYAPPFRPLCPDEERQMSAMINATGADIVFVGTGAVKQEKFMRAMQQRIEAPVMAGVGAAFDFSAGLIKEAPQWMQDRGLEWLFRLFQEPRRLLTRYVKYNTLFIFAACRLLLSREKT